MGEVDRSMMPLRMAQRYVEVYKKDGKLAAETWWHSFHWMPSQEEVTEMQKHVTQMLLTK